VTGFCQHRVRDRASLPRLLLYHVHNLRTPCKLIHYVTSTLLITVRIRPFRHASNPDSHLRCFEPLKSKEHAFSSHSSSPHRAATKSQLKVGLPMLRFTTLWTWHIHSSKSRWEDTLGGLCLQSVLLCFLKSICVGLSTFDGL
jgi:hypothetical protein